MNTPASVVSLAGQAWAQNANGSRRTLHPGDTLQGDEVVITAPGAQVEVDFGQGQVLSFVGDTSGATRVQVAPQAVRDAEPVAPEPVRSRGAQDDQEESGHRFLQLVHLGDQVEADGFTPLTVARIQEIIPTLEMALPDRGVGRDEDRETPTGARWQDYAGDPRHEDDETARRPDVQVALQGAGADGVYNQDEIGADGTVTARVMPGSGARAGDRLVVKDGNDVVLLDRVLTQDDLRRGVAVEVPVAPGQPEVVVTATVNDPRGFSGTAEDRAPVDNVAPELLRPLDPQVNDDADPVSLDLSQYFTDGSPMTWQVSSLPPGLSLDESTGLISGTLDRSASQGGQGGEYTLTVTVRDAAGNITTATLPWTVNNPAPEATDDAGSTDEDTLLEVPADQGVLGNDRDPDGDDLQVTEVTNGTDTVPVGTPLAGSDGGTFTLQPDGSYRFDPGQDFQDLAEGQTRTTRITYTVSDGEGGTDTAELVVTVTGTNDAPVITSDAGEHAGTVVEAGHEDDGTVVPGTPSVSGQMQAEDADQGAVLTWSVEGPLDGTYGQFQLDPQTGAWEYVLDNDLPATQALKEGESVELRYRVRVTDEHGAHAEQVVVVTVQGTNDRPVAVADQNEATESGVLNGGNQPEPGRDEVGGNVLDNDTDVDADAVLTVATVRHEDSGSDAAAGATLQGTYGRLTLNGDGRYTYVLDNTLDVTQQLAYGQSGQDVFTYTVRDEFGAESQATLTITVNGTNDVPVIDQAATTATGTVVEDSAQQGTASGTLVATDVDQGDILTWALLDGGQTAQGQYGQLTLNADTGEWEYQLDHAAVQFLAEGEIRTERFNAVVTDLNGARVTQPIEITIRGSNDVPEVSGAQTGAVAEDGVQVATGQLTVTDVDRTDTHSWSVEGSSGQYGQLVVDQTGRWTYQLNNAHPDVQALPAGSTLTDTITVLVDDGNGGTDSIDVTITIAGTNDAAQISGTSTGAVVEAGGTDNQDPGTASTGGTLTVQDADAGQAGFRPVDAAALEGTYGSFTFNASTGEWRYVLDNDRADTQALRAGEQVTEQLTVISLDGTASKTITVTVTGSNDVPVVSNDQGAVKEDENVSSAGELTASGTLTITDVDAGESAFDPATLSYAGNTLGGAAEDTPLGALVVNADGSWSYRVNNGLDRIQSLAAGDRIVETWTVLSRDGTATSTIEITIEGTNDVPVIQPHAGTVKEAGVADGGNAALAGTDVASGHLLADATDLDGDALTVTGVALGAQPGTVGTPLAGEYGSLLVNADGTWTYTLNNALEATQRLNAGERAQEVFTYTVSDGQGGVVSSSLTITVQGTNDRPQIQEADQSGAVIEAGEDGSGAPIGQGVASGQFTVVDPDGDGQQQTWSLDGMPDDTYGRFQIDQDGRWTFELDDSRAATQALTAGEVRELTYVVRVTDAHGAWDTREVTITITGSNDAAQITGTATGTVVEAGDLNNSTLNRPDAQGALKVTDVDAGEAAFRVPPSLDGLYGTFTFDEHTGEWSYRLDNDRAETQALVQDEQVTDTLMVTSLDGTATQVITVTITGSNDIPVVTDGSGQVKEDENVSSAGELTASGTLTITDVDAGQSAFDPASLAYVGNTLAGADQSTPLGTLEVNADGTWNYRVDNGLDRIQSLAAGERIVETWTVSSLDGTASSIIEITIEGTNDAPVIDVAASDLSGQVTEIADGAAGENVAVHQVGGTIRFSDVDTRDVHAATVSPDGPDYLGSLTLTPVDNANDRLSWQFSVPDGALDGLSPADRLIQTYTVTVSDGQGGTAVETITITIQGTNDVPVITSAQSDAEGSVTEDAVDPTTGGTLVAEDVDVNDSLAWSLQGTGEGVYGQLTLNPDGEWLYTLDNSRPETQALKQGETRTETFTAVVKDLFGGTATQVITVTVVGSNDAPETIGQLMDRSDEDADAISGVDVSQIFTDRDGDELSYVADGLPPGLSLDPNSGLISGTLDRSASQGGPNGDGVYTVTVTARDPSGATVQESFQWTVSNPVPVARDDRVTALEDTVVEGNVITGEGSTDGPASADHDPDGDSITVVAFEVEGNVIDVMPGVPGRHVIPGVGQLEMHSDGRYVFTPDLNWNGDMPQVTYTVKDGDGDSATAKLDITLTPVNDAPIVVRPIGPQAHEDLEDVSDLDVSEYFADPDGDGLTYTASGLPAGLSMDPNSGVISGTLDRSASQGGTNGVHQVVVTAKDTSGSTVSQTFEWTVTNPPPVANDDNAVTDEDTVLSGNVLTGAGSDDAAAAADVDPDGDPLVVVRFSVEGRTYAAGQTAIVTGGLLRLDADGEYVFTPEPDWNGYVPTVTYTISDGEGGVDQAQLNIRVNPVNDAPESTASLPDRADDDADSVQVDLSGFFRDRDGDPLTYEVTGLPPGLTYDPSTGLISGSIDPSASQGGPNQDGRYTVTVTVSDGQGGSTQESFQWQVSNPPPQAHDDVVTTDEDTPVSGNLITGAGADDPGAAADRDPDGDTLTVTRVTVGGQDYPVDPSAGAQVNIPGVGQLVVDSSGQYTFTPADDWHGQVPPIEYTLRDGDGDEDTAVLRITVKSVNDAPEPQGTMPDRDDADADVITGVNVRDYFDDADGDKLVFTAEGLPPGLSLDPNTGLISGIIDGSASQGGPNGDGVYRVTIIARDPDDEEARQEFDWAVSNPSPVARDDRGSTDEETVLSVPASQGVLGNDRDPDGDDLRVTEVTNGTDTVPVGTPLAGSDGGTFTLQPDGSYRFDPGQDFQSLSNGETRTTRITYTVSDGEGGTDTAELVVTVTGTNDAPVITSDAGEHAGTVVEAGHEDDGTVVPGTPSVSGQMQAEDADQGAVLTWSVEGPLDGTYGQFQLDPQTGAWEYVLDNDLPATQALKEGESVELRYRVRVTDEHGAHAEQVVVITVQGTNDRPVAVADQNAVKEAGVIDGGNVAEPGTRQVGGNVLDNDTDVDAGSILTVVGIQHQGTGASTPGTIGQPLEGTYGTLQMNADGSYTYTLDNARDATQALPSGKSGAEVFVYRVEDENGAWNETTLTITVTGTNDVPVIDQAATTDTGTVVEDATQDTASGRLVATDVDEGATQTWTLKGGDGSGTASGQYGSLVLNADGTWTYTLDNSRPATQALREGEEQTEVFEVVVTDDHGAQVTHQVTVKVVGTNDVPVAVDDAAQVTESGVQEGGNQLEPGRPSAQGNVLLNDTDADAGEQDALTVTQVQGQGVTALPGTVVEGLYGTLTLQADGRYTYVLDNDKQATQSLALGQAGEDVFEYSIVDAHGATSTARLVVTVNGTNDVPVITSPAAEATGSVIEAGGVNNTVNADRDRASGQLASMDVDDGATARWTLVDQAQTDLLTLQGTYGTLTIDPDTGEWTYVLDNTLPATERLQEGEQAQERFTARVTDEHGAWAEQPITISITGSNDLVEMKDAVVTFKEDPREGEDGNAKVGNVLDAAGIADVDDDLTLVDFWLTGDASQTYAPGETLIIPGVGQLTLDEDLNYVFTPLPHYSGEVPDISYRIKESHPQGETYGGKLSFRIEPVADEPVVRFADDQDQDLTRVGTLEDTAVKLGLKAPKVVDDTDHNGAGSGDQPELLGVITLSGLPQGAVLLDGSNQPATTFGGAPVDVPADGTLRIVLVDDQGQLLGNHLPSLDGDSSLLRMTVSQYEDLHVKPPEHDSSNFTVTVSVPSHEVNDDNTIRGDVDPAVGMAQLEVLVKAVADDVSLTFDDSVSTAPTQVTGEDFTVVTAADSRTATVTVGEDIAFDLRQILKAGFEDTDGSEERWITITSPVPIIVGDQLYEGGRPIRIDARPGAAGQTGDTDSFPEILIRGAEDFSGDIDGITITIHTQDRDADGFLNDDGSRASNGSPGVPESDLDNNTVTLNLRVEPRGGDIRISGVETEEDTSVAFLTGIAVTDQDGGREIIRSVSVGPDGPEWSWQQGTVENGQATYTLTHPEHGTWTFSGPASGTGWTLELEGGQLVIKAQDALDQNNPNAGVDLTSVLDQFLMTPPAHSSKDLTLDVSVGSVDISQVGGVNVISPEGIREGELKITVTPVAEEVGGNTGGNGSDLTMGSSHEYQTSGVEDEWFELGTEAAGASSPAFDLATGWANEDTSEKTYARMKPSLEYGDGSQADASGVMFRWQNAAGEWEEGRISSADGHVDVPIEFLSTLQFKAPPNFAGKFSIEVTAFTVDVDEDDPSKVSRAESGSLTLTNILIEPRADKATTTVVPRITSKEDDPIDLSIHPKSSDPAETFDLTFDLDAATLARLEGEGVEELWLTYEKDGVTTEIDLLDPDSVKTIQDFDPAATLTLQPPKDWSGSLNLGVTTVVVDQFEGPNGELHRHETPEADRVRLPVEIDVTGVPDEPRVTLLDWVGTEEGMDGDHGADREGVPISDLVRVELSDTDGSEKLTLRISNLDEGFQIRGVLPLSGGTGKDRVWILTEEQLASVRLVAPLNHAGVVEFDVTPVTTERDGASTTWDKQTVSFTIQPSAEAGLQSGGVTLMEDTLQNLGIAIGHRHGDTDETLVSVRIHAGDVESADGYVLYLGADGSQTLADAAADGVSGVVREGDWFVLTDGAWEDLHAQGAANRHGTVGDFRIEYVVEDGTGFIDTDPDRVRKDQKQFDGGRFVIDVAAETDPVQVELVGTEGSHASFDADEGTVTVTQPGDFLLKLDISKVPEADSGNVPDHDGSEVLTRILITGVPQGVVVAGAEQTGPDSWLIVSDKPFDGVIQEEVRFQVSGDVHDGINPITVRVITEDAGNGQFEEDVLEWDLITDGFQPGPAEYAALIEAWELADPDAQEDGSFTLGEAINGRIEDGVADNAFTITLRDLPPGTQVDGPGVVFTVIDGVRTWTIGGTGGNAALQAVLDGVRITPPADSNSNNGSFPLDATLATHIPNGYSRTERLDDGAGNPPQLDIRPVTDPGQVTVAIDSVPEGQDRLAITITPSAGVDTDGHTTILADGEPGAATTGTLYVRVTSVDPDFEGQLTLADGTPLQGPVQMDGQDWYWVEGVTLGEGVALEYTLSDPAQAGLKPGSVTVEAGFYHRENNADNVEFSTGTGVGQFEAVNNGFDLTLNPSSTQGAETDQHGYVVKDGQSNAIQLGIEGALADDDGSEAVQTLYLSGVPEGFLVYVGEDAASAVQASNAGKLGDATTTTWQLPLSSSGGLPPYVAVLPPQHWSGTVSGLELTVVSGEKSAEEYLSQDFPLGTVTVTPRADGLSWSPTLSFGKEGEVISLNLNASLKDPVSVGSGDAHGERVTLTLEGLGEHADFWIGNGRLDGDRIRYDKDSDTYTLTGLTQSELDQLGFVQAADAVTGTSLGITARTQEYDADGQAVGDPSEAIKGTAEISIDPTPATAGADTFLYGGALIDGGGGDDVVQLRYGESVQGEELAATLRNIEVLDLSVDGVNRIENLTLEDVLAMTDDRNILTIRGDGDDSISLAEGWTQDAEDASRYYGTVAGVDVTVRLEDQIQSTIVD